MTGPDPKDNGGHYAYCGPKHDAIKDGFCLCAHAHQYADELSEVQDD